MESERRMKSKAFSGIMLTLLLTLILNVQSAKESGTIYIACTLSMVSLEDPAPQDFRVTIKLPASSGYKPEDIDPATVRVEGIISMKPVPDWPKITKRFFAFKVDGSEVLDWVIWPKICTWHHHPAPK